MPNKIYVTKSFLPPQEEYQQYLDGIWQRDQLTNHGPLLKEFEQRLRERFDAPYVHFLTNGTLALQLSLHAIGVEPGEVITTPFSYVATTSAILWEGFTPVFVDIEPETFCVDPSKIEAAITSRTKAIMVTHVFGSPCDVEAIGAIAGKHDLPVIYDAAHAFSVEYKGKPLMSYGDIAVGSFHATKLFQTIEGGCVVTNRQDFNDKVELQKRFGHNADDHFMLGINAKASEFQAAMGLCNLKYVDGLIDARRQVAAQYDTELSAELQRLVLKPGVTHNYIYYPVVFEDEDQLLRVKAALEAEDIYPRRYFYPALNSLPYIKNAASCPVAERVAVRILALPLYAGLPSEDVSRISKIVNGAL